MVEGHAIISEGKMEGEIGNSNTFTNAIIPISYRLLEFYI